MNKEGNVKISVIKSIAAILCCIALIIGSNTIAAKVCESKVTVAQNRSGSSSQEGEANDVFAELDDIDAGTGSDTAQDAGDISADTAADAGMEADITDTSADAGTAEAPQGDSDASTSASSSSASAPKAITLTSGLTSTNKEEVLKYYRLVCAKNQNKTVHQTMYMTKLDGGSGLVGGAISAFEPIAKKALEKNSNDSQGLPGRPEEIQPSDWVKAKAVNDGTYTTVVVQVKDQTDGPNGKVHEGPVGRSIGVLDGVQRAIDDLNGVTADFENGKFALKYTNAYIKIKVKNSTGELVANNCEWHHTVNIMMDDLDVKVTVLKAHLHGATGSVEYSVKY